MGRRGERGAGGRALSQKQRQKLGTQRREGKQKPGGNCSSGQLGAGKKSKVKSKVKVKSEERGDIKLCLMVLRQTLCFQPSALRQLKDIAKVFFK